MKAILISINPKHVANILNGKKTIELRKTYPHCALPIDVYIYCTKDKKYTNLINRGGFLTGMVVAKFTLNHVNMDFLNNVLEPACVSRKEAEDYLEGRPCWQWKIDNLVIFDKPKEISEFYAYSDKKLKLNYHQEARWLTSLTRAPQSWCYIEMEN